MASVVARAAIISALGVGDDVAKKLAAAPSFQFSQPSAGSKWFSFVDGLHAGWSGQLVSAYYHPSKRHSATTKGKLGQKRSIANAGKWAVSQQSKALFGNKAYYNDL